MRVGLTTLLAALALSTACAHRFSQIAPGMTAAEVRQVMDANPTRITPFTDGYAAWYFDDDHCVLLQSERVVAKDETRTNASVYTPVVGITSRTRAQCLPPGVTAPAIQQTDVYSPLGAGTVN